MRKKELKIHLDDEMKEWARKQAKSRHCSISQVLRDLIVAEMGKKQDVSCETILDGGSK